MWGSMCANYKRVFSYWKSVGVDFVMKGCAVKLLEVFDLSLDLAFLVFSFERIAFVVHFFTAAETDL